jgi:hypothetical protein
MINNDATMIPSASPVLLAVPMHSRWRFAALHQRYQRTADPSPDPDNCPVDPANPTARVTHRQSARWRHSPRLS